MKTILISIIFFTLVFGQNSVEGYVFDRATDMPVSSVNIIVLGSSDGAATTEEGYFQIYTDATLPLKLVASHIAYISQLTTVSTLETIHIYLEPSVILGDAVSVTGNYARSDQEVSSSIKSLSLEEMESLAASDISDALRTVSSTSIEQAGGGKQTISIRGSNPNEVSVYLDGIRLNDAYSNTANIAAIDQNDMSSIEIIKGGNTTLFSNGNFGGVVLLNTQLPDSTDIKFARGFGLQDKKNQDLSFGAAGRYGPFAIGGRYSGKARRYHGRTTYTTVFRNLAFSAFPKKGTLDVKGYYLEDYLTLPTEAVVQSAQTQLGMIRYNGYISQSSNWEIFTSAKIWDWDDDFFSNLNRKIKDEILTARIGTGFTTSKLKSTFSMELENQSYSADNIRALSDYSPTHFNDFDQSTELGKLSRFNQSISGVLQLKSSVNNALVQQLIWELGFRADNIATEHIQNLKFNNTLSGESIEKSNVDTTYSNLLTGFKVGINTSGSANHVRYKLFLNQGRSSRLPTLNDIYLSNKELMQFNLDTEKLYSSEAGIEIENYDLDGMPGSIPYNISGGFFINNYSNKIAYQFREDGPPLPYNINLARISGFDINFSTSFYKDLLRINTSYQKININNPIIFPNKPSSKFSVHAELGYKLLSIGYDYIKEGSQFIVYNGFVGNSLVGRENTNISLIVKHKIWKANISLQYIIHNVFSDVPVIADPEINYLSPFNFFDVHRQIFTIKVQI